MDPRPRIRTLIPELESAPQAKPRCRADHTTRVNRGSGGKGLAKLVWMKLVSWLSIQSSDDPQPAPLRRSSPALRSSSPHSRSAAPFPAPAPLLCSAPLIHSSLSRLLLRFSDPRLRSAPPFLHLRSALRFSDSRSTPLIPTPFRSSGPHLVPQLRSAPLLCASVLLLRSCASLAQKEGTRIKRACDP
mgnify:CR=1 FL=1